MSIPLMDIKAQYGPLRAEIDAAIAGVLDGGHFILGPNVRGIEETVGERLGRPCVGVANGTDALVIALQALGVGPGDEVVTTPYTFYATAEAIARIGATPVFADIDPRTYCLDPAKAAARITKKTKAMIPVHIFGLAADMTALMQVARDAGIAVIEDTAQGFGARHNGAEVGTFGDIATYSFFPTKNFPGIGDGGLIAARDDELAHQVKRLRFHGSDDKVTFYEVGYNSRLDDLQAAVIRVFYPHVDRWNAQRQQVARWYAEAGLGEYMTIPAEDGKGSHIYHLYVARHPEREAIQKALNAEKIAAAVYYGIPMHLQPVFSELGYKQGDLPVAEECASTGLALPMHPHLTQDEVGQVVDVIRQAVT